MCGAHDDVQRGGVGAHDGGHRGDGGLVALARAEQAETQDHLAPTEPHLRLDAVRRDERQVGDAVRHDLHVRRVGAVGAGQQPRRRSGHHHGRRGHVNQLSQDAPLRRGRVLKDGVQRRHGRRAQGPHEVENVRPVRPAPDAVLVLNRYGIERAPIDPAGGAEVVRRDVASDATTDLDRIGADLVGRLKGDDLPVADGGAEVGRERGNAAALRWIGRNERDLRDGVRSSRGASAVVPKLNAGARPVQDEGRPREGSPRMWGRPHPNPDPPMSQGHDYCSSNVILLSTVSTFGSRISASDWVGATANAAIEASLRLNT